MLKSSGIKYSKNNQMDDISQYKIEKQSKKQITMSSFEANLEPDHSKLKYKSVGSSGFRHEDNSKWSQSFGHHGNPIQSSPIHNSDEPLDLSIKHFKKQNIPLSSDQSYSNIWRSDIHHPYQSSRTFDSVYWKILKDFNTLKGFTDLNSSAYFNYCRSLFSSESFNSPSVQTLPILLGNFQDYLNLQTKQNHKFDYSKSLQFEKNSPAQNSVRQFSTVSSSLAPSTIVNSFPFINVDQLPTSKLPNKPIESDVHSTTGDSNKPIRRPYTEAELSAAVRAICFGRLGTRRAASVYGIPRSTLRNKICKLNELKRREEERLGGKSIVMSEFLINLVEQSQYVSGMNRTNMNERSAWTEKNYSVFGKSLLNSAANAREIQGGSKTNGYMMHTASRVASIFQVNCRRSYNNRKIHDSKRSNVVSGQHKMSNPRGVSKLILQNRISKVLRNTVQKYGNMSIMENSGGTNFNFDETALIKYNPTNNAKEKTDDLVRDYSKNFSGSKRTNIKSESPSSKKTKLISSQPSCTHNQNLTHCIDTEPVFCNLSS